MTVPVPAQNPSEGASKIVKGDVAELKKANGHVDPAEEAQVNGTGGPKEQVVQNGSTENEHGEDGIVVPGIASLTLGSTSPSLPSQTQTQTQGSGSTPSPAPVPESALHKACTLGQIDTVRQLLSQSNNNNGSSSNGAGVAGPEGLETLDVVTGCTPIVLAIRNNHPEIVKELLNAGAIVPPPGITNDGYMMSILYPGMNMNMGVGMGMSHGGMYMGHHAGHPGGRMPMGQMQMGSMGQMGGMMGYPQHPMGGPGSPEFYGFYPEGPSVNGNGNGNGFRRSPNNAGQPSQSNGNGNGQNPTSPNINGAGNLPPAEVAKTIPCRNFPNCRYGASCVFFHPPSRPGMGPGGPSNGFYQGHPADFGGMNGYPVPAPGSGFEQRPDGQSAPTDGETRDADNGTAAPTSNGDVVPTPTVNGTVPEITTSTEKEGSSAPIPAASIPPVFIPSGGVPNGGLTSPQQHTHPLGGAGPGGMSLSPMSPSMLSGSLPSIPPADQFFAGSPPQMGMYQPLSSYGQQPQPFHMPPPPPNAAAAAGGPGGIPPLPHGQGYPTQGGHGRRQSFGQPFGAGGPGVPRHGKKPSFSGGPKPFRNGVAPGQAGAGGSGANGMGSWKDGNPPPCAFFAQGKCRNGELCKFPHLDEQGNDCRHPDVIRGIIPPLPPLSRQRGMRNGTLSFGAPFDPNMRNNQPMNFMYGQQPPFQPGPQHAHRSSMSMSGAPAPFVPGGLAPLPQGTPVAQDNNNNVVDSTSTSTSNDGLVTGTSTNLTSSMTTPDPGASETPDPLANPTPKASASASALTSAASPMPAITRSASQPGIQRVHVSVSGFNSRSHSPAPSNVSFHGNGHPRRGGPRGAAGGYGYAGGQGGRSASGDRKVPPVTRQQRIPGPDEFPALGGGSTTAQPSGRSSLSGTGGNNSPNAFENGGKTAAQVLSMPAPPKPQTQMRPKAPVQESTDVKEGNIIMEDDPESDAVIISRKDSSAEEAASSQTTETKSAGPAPAPAPASKSTSTDTSPNKRPGVSFANIIAASSNPVDASPVVVKA